MGQLSTCCMPELFKSTLTKEEMKNGVWLKPMLVTQIEFTEWTPDGHLRHSKFVGLREDKEVREVVRVKLEALPGVWRSLSNEWRYRPLLRQAIKTHS